LLVAVPLSPPNNATIAASDLPVPFLVRHASAAGDSVILVTLEVASDLGFSQKVVSYNVPQAAGGQTAINVFLSSQFTTYYWRVRAGSGETIGSFSDAFVFTVGPRADAEPRLFADAPTLLQPADGSLLGQGPLLVVRRAAHTGNPGSNLTFYEFLISTDLVRWTVGCRATEYGPADTMSCSVGWLSPGVYYWRAQTVIGRRFSDPVGGLTSAPSAVWSFTVTPQGIVVGNPIPVLPPYGAYVHPRPTLTVTRATRSGPTGALAYRFEVLSSGYLVATATVPEEGERTSWTVPFDLMIGIPYSWRVQAIDIASGVASTSSNYNVFNVMTSRSNLFMLDVRVPAACFPANYTFFASSADVVGGGHFTLTTQGDLRLDLMTVGGSVSGTIGGTASVDTFSSVYVSTSNDNRAPASVSGTLGANGQMSGTFSGFLKRDSQVTG
jgi:hypothetical protein